MGPRRLILAPEAVADLAGIYGFIAESSDVAALAFVEDLSNKIEWMARSGFTGVARDWIRPGLRALPYRDRCFYFRVDDEAIYLLRVLHGKQDVSKQEFVG